MSLRRKALLLAFLFLLLLCCLYTVNRPLLDSFPASYQPYDSFKPRWNIIHVRTNQSSGRIGGAASSAGVSRQHKNHISDLENLKRLNSLSYEDEKRPSLKDEETWQLRTKVSDNKNRFNRVESRHKLSSVLENFKDNSANKYRENFNIQMAGSALEPSSKFNIPSQYILFPNSTLSKPSYTKTDHQENEMIFKQTAKQKPFLAPPDESSSDSNLQHSIQNAISPTLQDKLNYDVQDNNAESSNDEYNDEEFSEIEERYDLPGEIVDTYTDNSRLRIPVHRTNDTQGKNRLYLIFKCMNFVT